MPEAAKRLGRIEVVEKGGARPQETEQNQIREEVKATKETKGKKNQ